MPAADTDPALLNRLCEDLALALRAAAHHGLSEGVCNHFSVALPDDSRRFLINPRGLHWSEVGADDIVLIDEHGTVLQGHHRVEPTAMFIHGAVHRITGHAVVLHTHMPYATALTLTRERALDPCSSQGAMRFYGRIGIDADYNGLALDWAEGERIARAMQGREVAFLANHGVIVTGASVAHAYDDLYYLERACLHQVLAMSTGRPLLRVNEKLSAHVAAQIQGEREQSDLFFEALRRMLPAPRRAAIAAVPTARAG
jgi:ribulose-5-phosphate 4-epimerase/fuculose-1-phosphate aldolase